MQPGVLPSQQSRATTPTITWRAGFQVISRVSCVKSMRDQFDDATYWWILDRVRATHRVLRFSDVRDGTPPSPFAILRHDVDYSPGAALRMAELEAERGIHGTYFLLLNGIYYNALEPSCAHLPAALSRLGHEVGLHYDVNFLYTFPEERWVELTRLQARVLEHLSGAPVVSIAMHQPALNGRDPLRGRTEYLNAYDERFTVDMRYLSDSARAWRDDAWTLLESGSLPPRLQLGIHPINWGPASRTRRAIFDGIHATKTHDITVAREALNHHIDRHGGVIEHEAALARLTGATRNA